MPRRSVRARSRRRAVWMAAGLLALATAGVAAHTPEAWAQEERRGWLGVELERAANGAGVVAKHVVKSSPAAKAGVADGDQLVSVDGVPLEQPRQLVARIAMLGPGLAIKLVVRHGGAERELTATLAAFPGSDQVLRLDKVGTFAPAWKNLTPVAGALPATLGQLRGRVVVMDFWATWCGPCRMMAPILSRWQTTYGAQGLAVVGVTGDTVPIAARAAQTLDMRYAVASDAGEGTASTYGVRALPTMFVIDKRGVIREVFIGFDPGRHKEVERLLTTLLAEPAP